MEHCLHFDNLSSFVHSQAIERKDNIKENINLFLRKWHLNIGNEFLFAKQILLLKPVNQNTDLFFKVYLQ